MPRGESVAGSRRGAQRKVEKEEAVADSGGGATAAEECEESGDLAGGED